MSTAVIIGVIGLGLFILIAIAIAMQTMEKNRKERKRLISNLQARIRNFEYMLNGFPEGFLGRDLQILVCKCLQEVYQQLTKIEPGNPLYNARSEDINQEINQLREQKIGNKTVVLTDQEQIKEIQKMLKSLFSFITKLAQNGRISGNDIHAYANQIRTLMLQTTTDSLNKAIKDALKDGKFKLAIHHLNMAINKIQKENRNGIYNDKIAQYQKQLDELTDLSTTKDEEKKIRRQEHDDEWDELAKPDDSWKKKAIYD